jgi:hypothetical protein
LFLFDKKSEPGDQEENHRMKTNIAGTVNTRARKVWYC